MADWQNQLTYVTKNGTRVEVLPKTRLVALEVADAAIAAGQDIVRIIGATTWYQHNERLSVDFVGNTAMQRWIAAYLVKHEDRLDVEYIISNRRMWRAYARRALEDNKGRGYGSFAAKTWAPYGPQDGPDAGTAPDPGRFIGTDNPHTDHVHLTLYPGAYAPPAKPSKPVVVPEPNGKQVTLANLRRGKDHADVVTLQKALIKHGQKIPAGATGFYGDQTDTAVRGFQRSVRITVDGVLGPVTAARLGLTVRP